MSSVHRNQNLSLRPAEPRATPPSTGQRFRESLAQGAGALVGMVAGDQAQSLVAVARSSGDGPSASGPSGATGMLPGVGGTDAAATSLSGVGGTDNDAMQLLALQQQMNVENRQFTTLSNVMRARHDTAKSVIGNVRG